MSIHRRSIAKLAGLLRYAADFSNGPNQADELARCHAFVAFSIGYLSTEYPEIAEALRLIKGFEETAR